MLTVASFCAACVLSDIIDRFARPTRALFGGGALALAFRAVAVGWLWALAMTISQRPAFSLLAVLVTVLILVVISNLKRSSLAEPLVFSDFAFLAEIVRHPRLFYLERWAVGLIAGVAVAIVALTTVWWRIEFRVTSAATLSCLALTFAAVLPMLPVTGPQLDCWAAKAAGAPRLDAHLTSLGLLGSLVVYWIRWCEEGRAFQKTSHQRLPEILSDAADYDAIVIVQSESFIDLRRFGSRDLSLRAYDALKVRARAAGLIEVPCVGAYTLRPEAAVITGYGFQKAGFTGFHPYLRSRFLAPWALPRRLPANWRSTFLHPYINSFFLRDRAVPQFGFASFIDRSQFSDADREGLYVGDIAVGRRVLETLAEGRREGWKPFIQVVTMEAHDPFGPGRLPGEDDPTRQFLHHLRNADRMLALLTERLDAEAERVLLIHYGDHVPVLKDFADPFPDTRTDFLVVELGRSAKTDAFRDAIRRPEDLHALLLARFKASDASLHSAVAT